MDWFKLNAVASCPFFKCWENNTDDRRFARKLGRRRLKKELRVLAQAD